MSGVPASDVAGGSRRVVARNTMVLMIAQALSVPLSIVVNAVMGRTLGPEDYGAFYILTTFANVAFLFVDWGQAAVLPARIATDRAQASRYLGVALAWKAVAAVAATALLVFAFKLQGKGGTLLASVALVCLGQALTLVARTCADVVRGFERVDVAAYTQTGGQFLVAIVAIPTLYLTGALNPYLVAAAVAGAATLLFAWRGLRTVGIGRLSADLGTLKTLLREGTTFLALNLILLLQPAIDAYYLSRLASQEAIGWHAAAVKLIGPLVLPAGALIAALYPTLCRLWAHDRAEYQKTAQGALRASVVMMVPLALGCGLFPDVGTRIFNQETFGPTESNLRILAGYVFLLYVTMTLGTCLNAAGRQKAWTVVQFVCIVIVLVADPILIPWFQQHYGNGSLGVNLTTTGTELLMLLAALVLMPRGIVDRSVVRAGALAITSGLAMAAVAWLLRGLDSLIVAPVAVCAYVGVLYALGGIDPDLIASLRRRILKR